MEYLELAWTGWKNFIGEYKYLALILGILFYAAASRERLKDSVSGRFLRYSAVATLILMVPVTAAFALLYQTRFYDYPWIWSFVPLSAVLSWGIVTIVFEQLPSALKAGGSCERKKRYAGWVGILAAAAVLFVCGNQGKVAMVSEEEVKAREEASQILQYMEEAKLLEGRILWGPADILQYMRMYSGEVLLLYGRDMWDGKSGAYDYESYTPEEIACYEWMERIADDHNLYLLEIEQATEEIYEALADQTHLQEGLRLGATAVILPKQLDEWMERKLKNLAVEAGLQLEQHTKGEYTLWILEDKKEQK